MVSGAIALFMAFLVMLMGFAALRRPLASLVEFDPIGKRLLAARGEAFTLRSYRIFGAAMVLVGIATAYLALQILRA
jgi:hypothetical protein